MHPVGRLGIRLKFKEKVGFWINSNAIIVPPVAAVPSTRSPTSGS